MVRGAFSRWAAGASLAAVVALVLACGGCGSSSSSSSSGAKSSGTSGQSSSTQGGGSQSGASKALPDPCTLVSSDEMAKLLGGPIAKPKASNVGNGSKACLWELQKNVDSPDPSTMGHTLTLTVLASPAKSMTPEQNFENTSQYSPDKTPAHVCEKSFWANNILNALQNGVYLNGLGGLASSDAAAKSAVEQMMAAACKSL